MHRMFVMLFSASILAGCASSGAGPQEIDCAALDQVIDAAADDFQSISGAKRITRYGEARAVKLHPYGECSIFVAAGEPALYLCGNKSAEQDKDRMELIAATQACLGTGWQRSELAGGGAVFIREGVQVTVGKTDPRASHDSSVGLTLQRR